MNKNERHQKQPSTRSVVRLLCFLFVTFMLNACLGCQRMLNIKVENTSTSSITVLSIESLSLNGVDKEDIQNLGTISAGGTEEYQGVIFDKGEEFLLQIQDAAGKTIGEVRQSREVVQSKMEGRTWCVKIPADMTPVKGSQSTQTTSR